MRENWKRPGEHFKEPKTTKNMLKKKLIKILAMTGFASATRKIIASKGRFVLEFHGITKRRYSNLNEMAQDGFTVNEFRNIIEWLETRFTFITPDELINNTKKGILLTFDDGLANNYRNVIPILKSLNIPAVFFITTQHVEDPRNWLNATRKKVEAHWRTINNVPEDIAADLYDGMNKEQMTEIAGNRIFTIGSHTVSHPFLTRCTDDELKYELYESKKFLEEAIEKEVKLFAYPTGDYDSRVIESVRDAGYAAAFTEDSKKPVAGRFEIPRIGIYSADHGYLSMKTSGLYQKPI